VPGAQATPGHAPRGAASKIKVDVSNIRVKSGCWIVAIPLVVGRGSAYTARDQSFGTHIPRSTGQSAKSMALSIGLKPRAK